MAKYTSRQRVIMNKLKAKTLLEVFKETGQINKMAAYDKLRPNASPVSKKYNTTHMFGDDVMREFEKMIHVDDDALAKIKNDRILKELWEDINRLNIWLNSGQLTAKETAVVSNAKDAKLKMLGMAGGIWRAPKEEPQDEDAQMIFESIRRRFHGEN